MLVPLYLDRHEVPGASPEDVAAAHVAVPAEATQVYEVDWR